ncbi:MAG: DUF3572 domain-containing protein [Rhodobacteraceae bacterium]|nr:DUF3572 domain-containing protein [Paracoccaceae bacterium]
MEKQQAEILAIQALSWLAADEEILGQFLNTTGAAPGDLRARAAEPEFLGFVLDFIMRDDETILGFCTATKATPESVQRARAALGGGLPNWT